MRLQFRVLSVLVAIGAIAAAAGTGRAAVRPAVAARSVLLVDDDGGQPHEQPYAAELSGSGWALATWSMSAQGQPSVDTLLTPDLVVWVTGGGWNDLSPAETRLIEARVRRGASTVVAGKYSGRALSFGFLDRQLFGIDYRATTFTPESIAPADGFPSNVRVATDHAVPSGADVLWGLKGGFGSDPGTPGHAVVTRHWAWGSRTAWIGFDLRDVWAPADQRRILRDVLWYVAFQPDVAVAELESNQADGPRARFLTAELERELIRHGRTDTPLWRAVAASKQPALRAVAARLSRVLRRDAGAR